MPFLKSSAGEYPCELFYEVKGDKPLDYRDSGGECTPSYSDRPSVVLIMGFAATHNCWDPQLEELLRPKIPGGPPRTRVLLLDNRGVGRSSSPKSKHAYTTTAMATDVICLLDHLGWGKVHVVGHSMGSMIATKLAALVPHRIASLVLVSPTGGGWQALPRTWSCLKVAVQIAFAKTPKRRAWLDLQLHFNKKMLNSVDTRYGRTREELLHEDYLEAAGGGGPGQSADGFWGQLHAVLSHRLSRKEVTLIKEANVPTMVIHGRYDVLALPRYGEALARRLEAPCVILEGAHMLCRERGPEVNLLLHHHIFHGRRLKDTQHKFLIDDPMTCKDRAGGGKEGSPSSGSSPALSSRSGGSSSASVDKAAGLNQPIFSPGQL